MNLLDCTDKSPLAYRVRMRDPEEVVGVCAHQMGVGCWKPDNAMFYKVRAHAVVQKSGRVLQLHPWLCRLRYGSGVANSSHLTIELEGAYPTSPGKWWRPDTMGRDRLEDHPEQVAAARDLIRYLRDTYPRLRTITGHRAIQRAKSGCPGPDLYREVVMYSVLNLGMREGPVWEGGAPIPEGWRGTPTM